MSQRPWIENFWKETKVSRILILDSLQGTLLTVWFLVLWMSAQWIVEQVQRHLDLEGSPTFDFLSICIDLILGGGFAASLALYVWKSVGDLRVKLGLSSAQSVKREWKGEPPQPPAARRFPKSKARRRRRR